MVLTKLQTKGLLKVCEYNDKIYIIIQDKFMYNDIYTTGTKDIKVIAGDLYQHTRKLCTIKSALQRVTNAVQRDTFDRIIVYPSDKRVKGLSYNICFKLKTTQGVTHTVLPDIMRVQMKIQQQLHQTLYLLEKGETN